MADGYTSAGKPIPEWWIREIHKGKSFRRLYAHEDSWPQWRKWYRGEWSPSILPSNVYFKMMRTLIPRVYYRNPSVSITASIPGVENMLFAKIIERADNKLLDILGVKAQMKKAVQNGCMFGLGALRLGYGAEFTPTPDDLSTDAPDVGSARVRKRVEYNDLVHPNMPWILSAHPGSVIFPDKCVDIHSARWVAFESVRSYEDVKADPRLTNTADLMPGVSDGHLVTRSSSNRVTDGVVLWEVRDKKTGLVFVLAPHAINTRVDDKCLFISEDDMQINGRVPCYPLIFNNDDEVIWGISDSQIISPQQGEVNEIRTQIRNHRRIAIAKILAEAGAITPDEKSKLIDGNAGAVIEVKNMAAIKEMNPMQIPAALIEAEGIISSEVQQLLGLGVNQFGEYAPGSADRSATESNIVNAATQIRVDERRDACADLLTDIVNDMNHVIMEHWDSEMVVDIVGPAGVPIWLKVQPSEMKSLAYNIKVDPDTSLPLTKGLREQKAVQTYGILKTNPLINPIELTRFLLSEMYGVDQDALMLNPAMNTSQQNPMTPEQAGQHIGQLPQGAIADLQSRLSAQPAQIIPPQG